MSSKKGSLQNDHGLDGLSLTGSQVGTPMSSARSTGRSSSAKVANKPNSTGARLKSSSATNINGVSTGAKAKNKSSKPVKTGPNSARSVSTYRDTPRTSNQDSARSKNTLTSPSQPSAGNDFLSFFENTNPTKPKLQGSRTTTKSKTAWGSTVDTPRSQADSEGDHTSRAGSKTSKFSHSVFQPVSARSTSTVEDNDFENNLNYNTDSKTSVKEDSSYHNNARGPLPQHQKQKSSSKENLFSQRQRSGSGEDLSLSRGRNPGAAGDANDFLNSHQNNSSQKATKLNSIANNMTSQAFSPGNKASLLGLENSYQNIKHKTPINQVRQSPQPQVGRNIAEDFVKTCNMAATKIQRWFRRNGLRKKTSEAAMKRMLETKRREMEEARASSNNEEIDRDSKRKQDREEKARLARMEAISELQKKREMKREENKQKSEEEIKFLQASGKITKKPANKSNVKKRQTDQTRPKTQISSKGNDSGSESERGAAAQRPPTSGSNGRVVDNFFQNTEPDTHRQANTKSESSSPRSDKSDDQLDNRPLEGATGNLGNELSPRPSQTTTTKTTLEDLMATLQTLEAEEKFASARKDKNENPTGWLDELEKNSSHSEKDDHHLSADALEHLNHPKPDNLVKSGLLTDEKLRSIMTYLDDVEMAERLTEIDNEIAKANEILDRPAPLVPSGEEIVEIEQATAHAAEVTNKMLTQKMELEEKKRTVQMLQKALNQQRELTVRHAKETEKEMKKRLDVQKDEYEETIKRHLSFIDQLIDDKKSLSEKCENLVKELKQIDRKYQEKIKSLTDSHEVETRKLKDVHQAAEKLRREKWIDEKTKKIKEMTVKGLEPEIQRLIAKHKGEIKKVKSIHEAELMASDERAGQRYVQMTEELRDQLAKEKEMACSRERELARQTYEKQLQSEEEAFQQQRRRLYAEVQEEKERISQQAARQRTELDRLQRQLEDTHGKTISSTRAEYEKAREEQEKRHHLELKQSKEQLAVEKASWEENYMKKQETWILQKERELKEQVRKERDREIEMVIQRLEEDNQGSREECERVADNRIKRIRDKYESEMSELERSERQTMEKYNQTKAFLAEIEGESERMKVTVKQKDREVNEVKKLLDKLNHERDHVSDVVRQEFADKIVSTDEENRRLKTEMSELKSRHRIELERGKTEIEVVQKSKEEEMDEVHKRVKQAILKKEDVVTQLKQQYQAAVKRADHLEGLLEQQRKQLLGKK